tara:strand:- start:35 stop:241 length:207 start_codon:yes stop_codon:yes gene_type:complete
MLDIWFSEFFLLTTWENLKVLVAKAAVKIIYVSNLFIRNPESQIQNTLPFFVHLMSLQTADNSDRLLE